MDPGCWNNPLSFRKSNNYIWIIDDWIGCQRIIFIHSIEIWEMILFLLFLLSWYVCFFCLQPMDSHWTSQNSTGQVWSASSLGCISEGSTQFIVQWRGWGATYRPRKKAEDKRSLLPHREKRSQIWRIMDHPSRCFTWNSRSFFSLFCWTNMERKKYTTNFGRRQQTQQRLCPLPKSAEGTQRIRLPLTKWSLGRHPFQARLILRDEAWRRNFHFHLLRAVFAVVDSIQLKRGMNKGLGFFQWFWQRVSYNNIIHIL